MSRLAKFSKLTSQLLPVVGQEIFATKLAELFKNLFQIDNIMMVVYPRRKLPRIEFNDLPPQNRKSTAEQFITGAFLLDPYYLAARHDAKFGFFHLSDIVPKGFRDSEYYQSYYSSSGIKDECGYLIPLSEDGRKFVNISIGLYGGQCRFSQEELTLLADIEPLISAICQCHWQQIDMETDSSLDLRSQLEMALDCFGNSLLTDRENQIVQLILRGYSNKSIAEKYSISIETVKLHRKNAYAKLDLGTQGELFNLFINSLMNMENYDGGDPLINYLS